MLLLFTTTYDYAQRSAKSPARPGLQSRRRFTGEASPLTKKRVVRTIPSEGRMPSSSPSPLAQSAASAQAITASIDPSQDPPPETVRVFEWMHKSIDEIARERSRLSSSINLHRSKGKGSSGT